MEGNIQLEQLADASSVLVLGSTDVDGALFREAVATAGRPRVLGVTYAQSPGRWLRTHGLADDPSVEVSIVDVGGQSTDQRAFADGGLVDIECLANPGDLTGLGIALNQQLQEWDEGDLTLWFDSLTALLQYAELSTTYRFLHLLVTKLELADVTGYFVLDPDAHDTQTLHTLLSLFDAAVEIDPETGNHSVRTR